MDALWVALVAAGAAIIASATTGWFTTRAAQAQAKTNLLVQQEQLRYAQGEARHQQRRQAYATFIKAVGTVQTKVADLTSVAHDAEAFEEILPGAREDRACLMSATHEAFLEGPAHVGERVRELYNAVDRYWAAVMRMRDAHRTDDTTQASDCRARVISCRNALGPLRIAFVEAAQGALNPGEATAAQMPSLGSAST
ncbi:hypothetical protein [Streptomyces zaomyceticus]|uniref:hypothetical protein n=1 Tax=Streptomyces zaomyceticus TaxID=68286 RepID=UPI0016730F9D|nr:hypothetical protein [Streptomyces zaomyceticus]